MFSQWADQIGQVRNKLDWSDLVSQGIYGYGKDFDFCKIL